MQIIEVPGTKTKDLLNLSNEKNGYTLSTGQTSGLIGMSIQTIQRYVRKYAEHFTEHARQPKKGRRFSSKDIRSLLIIRSLMIAHNKRDIEATLNGETDYTVYEITDFMSMFINLAEMQRNVVALLDLLDYEKKVAVLWQNDFKAVWKSHADAIEGLRWDVSRLQLVRDLKNKSAVPPEIERLNKKYVARSMEDFRARRREKDMQDDTTNESRSI
jgi:DNA-binding transcriptional MerR regulator